MSLNAEQTRAVEHGGGPLLILAGAGTGKTRVLTHRIAHLIQNKGVHPGRILAVTFTNKAAGEMRHRLEKLAGPAARELWVGTFHAIAVKILRRHALEAGLAPDFLIYDAPDQVQVLKAVLKQLNLDDKRFPPRSLAGRISRLKDALTSPEEFKAKANDPFSKTLAEIYRVYEEILQANHALDFGDLLFRTVRLLEEREPLRHAYQERWLHVLVDEYQDTNHAQYRLVRLMSEKHGNLCVVGDPDQSIYRWRGADLHNILDFERDYPKAAVIRLEQNYRSVPTILKAANHLIANNALRREKALWSARKGGEKITVAALGGEKEEARFLVETFRRLHETEGLSYSAMAVFYRTNAQSRAFEEFLRMAGIPYLIYGGIRFYERAEVKDALAYLRILSSPSDSFSFKRIINTPPRGIGKTTVDRIDREAQEAGISFYERAKTFGGHAKLREFMDWFESLRPRVPSLPLVELLQTVLESSGLVPFLARQATAEARDRLDNLNELAASLHDFQEAHPEGKLADYLEQVALITDLDQESGDGMISLMTLHLAKGLEYPVVGVVGLEEGLLPHARSMDDPEELEEERRLFYVGMTRAMDRLYLTHAWRRFLNGQEQYGLPSRFLEELPAETICVAGHNSPQPPSYSKRGGPKPTLAPRGGMPEESRVVVDDFNQEEPEGFRRGQKVRHADFGIGFVVASEKTSLGEKVTVQFTNGAVKKLIAQYARLEVV